MVTAKGGSRFSLGGRVGRLLVPQWMTHMYLWASLTEATEL